MAASRTTDMLLHHCQTTLPPHQTHHFASRPSMPLKLSARRSPDTHHQQDHRPSTQTNPGHSWPMDSGIPNRKTLPNCSHHTISTSKNNLLWSLHCVFSTTTDLGSL